MVRRVSNESLVCVNYLLTIHVTVHPKIIMQGMGEVNQSCRHIYSA